MTCPSPSPSVMRVGGGRSAPHLMAAAIAAVFRRGRVAGGGGGGRGQLYLHSVMLRAAQDCGDVGDGRV